MLTAHLDSFFNKNHRIFESDCYAVAVSGGPDSMALAHSLSTIFPDKLFYILSVDHDLRSDSAAEVMQVKKWCVGFPNLKHQKLKWEGNKPSSSIMEEARKARYDLMQKFCLKKKISYLFLGHHQDDQRETFFIRLSKGSGFDGLGCMEDIKFLDNTLCLVRPFLDIPKSELVAYCDAHNLPYSKDPSNKNDKYLRPRLRQIVDFLEKEGFSLKRISQLIKRINRAKKALDMMTLEALKGVYHEDISKNKLDIKIDIEKLRLWPDEIRLRVLIDILDKMSLQGEYGIRLEKIEDLHETLWDHINKDTKMKRRSLGHCLITYKPKDKTILIEKENE